jgi:hypothetical protein
MNRWAVSLYIDCGTARYKACVGETCLAVPQGMFGAVTVSLLKRGRTDPVMQSPSDISMRLKK